MTHIPTDTLSRKWHRHLAAKSTIHGAHMGQGWSGFSLNISEFKGRNVKEIIRKPPFSSSWNHHFSYISSFNTTILPNTSTKNRAFHRQRSSPCWAWWSTTVGCSIGATPLSLWHPGAAGEHGERTWGHGQFLAIGIYPNFVYAYYIYVCVFVSETECWHMYIHVIFIELCGLPVLMHIEGFVAKLCILYTYIYIVTSFMMSNSWEKQP